MGNLRNYVAPRLAYLIWENEGGPVLTGSAMSQMGTVRTVGQENDGEYDFDNSSWFIDED